MIGGILNSSALIPISDFQLGIEKGIMKILLETSNRSSLLGPRNPIILALII
jgi:hypothetical protein